MRQVFHMIHFQPLCETNGDLIYSEDFKGVFKLNNCLFFYFKNKKIYKKLFGSEINNSKLTLGIFCIISFINFWFNHKFRNISQYTYIYISNLGSKIQKVDQLTKNI